MYGVRKEDYHWHGEEGKVIGEIREEPEKVDYSTEGIYRDFTYGNPSVSRGLLRVLEEYYDDLINLTGRSERERVLFIQDHIKKYEADKH